MNQIKAGAILSYLTIFLTALVTLIFTPIMISTLGQSEFGLYSLIASFAAYLSVLDMGIGNAIVRYNARNIIIGNKNKESQLNSFFLFIFIILGFIATIIGAVFYFAVDEIFGKTLSNQQIDKAKFMIIILTINYALSLPLSTFTAIIQAYERFVLVKLLNLLKVVGFPLIATPLLFLGFESTMLVIVNTSVTIATLLIGFYYARKYLNINFTKGKLDKSLVKEILGYSFFIFLNAIIDQIYWNTDQLIIGALSGTGSVALMAVAIQFIRMYMMLSTAISGVFLPRVSKMDARNATVSEFTNLMTKVGRFQSYILMLILTGFILYGRRFLEIWAGEEFVLTYYVVVIIFIPLFFPLIQNIGISILQAKNMHHFRAIVYSFIAVLNILITIPLVLAYDVIGSAIATAASLSIGHIVLMNIYYHKVLKLDMCYFWKHILKIMTPVIVWFGFAWVSIVIINIDNDIALVLHLVIYLIGYLVIIWFKSFNKYEKDMFRNFIKKLLKR